jgi:hypothetical protein
MTDVYVVDGARTPQGRLVLEAVPELRELAARPGGGGIARQRPWKTGRRLAKKATTASW